MSSFVIPNTQSSSSSGGSEAVGTIGQDIPSSAELTGVSAGGTLAALTQPLTDTQLRAAAVPVSGTFFQATQPVSAVSLPLPTGAATSAKQDTAQTRLDLLAADATITARLGTLGQKAMSGSAPVVIASNQTAVPTIDTAAFDSAHKIRVEIAAAAALAANAAIWFVRNTHASRKVHIRRLFLNLGFSGTAAASRSIYHLIRFSAATPSGGTTIAAVKDDSTNAVASAVGAAQQHTAALTVTGVTFDTNPIALFGHTNQLSASVPVDLDLLSERIILNPGEGLAIRAHAATVAGSFGVGFLSWSEMA